ncbi:MAG: hypothetical protein VX589_00935 [Myxococcota bacterium]|nr:hypothetical protein [Myxococcota bacterium]
MEAALPSTAVSMTCEREIVTPPTDKPTDLLREAWTRLTSAPKRHRDPWRLPSFATVGPGALPEVRTVVLRRVDPVARELEIHTDTASSKMAALATSPSAAFCFWDAKRSVQLRMSGPTHWVELASSTEIWQSLGPNGQRIYQSQPVPGEPITAPASVTFDGPSRFARVICTVETIDWLRLRRPAQERWIARWQSGDWVAGWVAP